MKAFVGAADMTGYQPGEEIEEPEDSKLRILLSALPALDGIGHQLLELTGLGFDVSDREVVEHAHFMAEVARRRACVDAVNPDDATAGAVVYYIQVRDTIKIGFTTQSVDRRRRQLAGDRVLAVEPGSRRIETRRLNQFRKVNAHIAGVYERFHPTPELMDHIIAVRLRWPEMQVGGLT